MRRAIVLSLLGALGCTPIPRAFVCDGDGNCINGGMQGHCEATRFCSFADGTCASGRRYGQFAGDGLGQSCVIAPAGDGGSGDMTGAPGNLGSDGGLPVCGVLDDSCCTMASCNSGLTCTGASCLGCVIAVAAGDAHSCAIKSGGSIWCWGKNDKGQLGNGTMNDALVPSQVVDNNGIAVGGAVELAAGANFTCARKSDGTALCWGANDVGQLGTGDAKMANPVPSLIALSMITTLGAGQRHACAALQSGTLWCWGANDSGQLGPGAPGGSSMPSQAVDKGNQPIMAVAVAGGVSHTCAVRPDHTLWCWGSDVDGELGDGAMAAINTPVQVATLGAHVTSVAAGAHFTCALMDTGGLDCFGLNDHGQAGAAGGQPVAVPAPLALSSLTRVTLGAAHGCARRDGGDVFCWGANAHGQLGDGSMNDSPSPVRPRGGAGVIAGGLAHSCAARADGIDCWGADAGGQLGNGLLSDRDSPTATQLSCP